MKPLKFILLLPALVLLFIRCGNTVKVKAPASDSLYMTYGKYLQLGKILNPRFDEYVFHDRFGDTIVVLDYDRASAFRFIVIGKSVFTHEVTGSDSVPDDRGKYLANIGYDMALLIRDFTDSARTYPLLLHLYDDREYDSLLTQPVSLAGVERLRCGPPDKAPVSFMVQEIQLDQDPELERIVETDSAFFWNHQYEIRDRKGKIYSKINSLQMSSRNDFFDSATYDRTHDIIWLKSHGWGSGFYATYLTGYRLANDSVFCVVQPVIADLYNAFSGLAVSPWSTSAAESSEMVRSESSLLRFRVTTSYEVYDDALDSSMVIFEDASMFANFRWNKDSLRFVPANAMAKYMLQNREDSEISFYKKKICHARDYGTAVQRKYLAGFE